MNTKTMNSVLLATSLVLLLVTATTASPVQASATSSSITEVVKAVIKPDQILESNAKDDDEILLEELAKAEKEYLLETADEDKHSFFRAVTNSGTNRQRELGSLGDCRSDCDRNSDCGSNSFCFQRRTGSSLPPCCGGSKPSDSRDFCVPVGCASMSSPPPAGGGDSLSVDLVSVDVGLVCFSKDVVVDVLGKGNVAMADLVVGDHILSSHNRYQRVYSFGHMHHTLKGEFLVIATDAPPSTKVAGTSTSSNNKLEITGEHLIFVQGKSVPVRAKTLAVGDKLTPSGATITEISTITKRGVYAPLTVDGTFLVKGGHQVSSYAALVQYDTKSAHVQLQGGHSSLPISQHDGIHMVLTPFRLWCSTNHSWWFLASSASSAGVCDSYNDAGMPHHIQTGIDILTWTNERSMTFQVSFFMVAFPIFGALMVLEQLLQSQQQWYGCLAVAMVALVIILGVVKKMTSGFRIIKVKTI